MVLRVQKNASRVHYGSRFGNRWLGGEGLSVGKLRKEIFGFVPADDKTVVETAKVLSDISCIGAQRINAVAVAKDEAVKYSGGMSGVRWDEQVEIK